jgi:hypothetical protein
MKRPAIKTAAAVLVIALVFFSAVWPLVGLDEVLGLGSGRSGGMGQAPQGGMPQGTPPAFDGTPLANMPGQMAQGTPLAELQGTTQPGQGGVPAAGMQPNMPDGTGQSGLMPVMRILQYVLYAIIIVCGLIAFGGIWMVKRWGTVMAIITATIVAVMTVTSLIGVMSSAMLIESIIKLLLVVAVVVLALIPAAKASTEPELT